MCVKWSFQFICPIPPPAKARGIPADMVVRSRQRPGTRWGRHRRRRQFLVHQLTVPTNHPPQILPGNKTSVKCRWRADFELDDQGRIVSHREKIIEGCAQAVPERNSVVAFCTDL